MSSKSDTILNNRLAQSQKGHKKKKHSGKNWLIKDFEPHHLKTIYRLYNDRIVDEYLNGNLGNRTPNIIKAF